MLMKSFVQFLLLATPDGGSGGSGSIITTILPFALIIGIFYFLIIRPQNKKQKDTQKMLDTLKKGDKVVTIGGIHGVIQSVKEGSVILRIDDTTKVEFSRSAISTVSSEGKAEKPEKAGKADKVKEIEAKQAETPETDEETDEKTGGDSAE
jgi:preprotein translocase subunit YajC